MKYQIVVHENKELVPLPPGWNWGTQIGHDRDVDRSTWPEYNTFRAKVLANGGLDRYWGPLDSIQPLPVNGVPDERYALSTFTFNTLEAAEEFFNMTTTQDQVNLPKNDRIYLIKVVEIEDDGTFVRIVKTTNTRPLPT